MWLAWFRRTENAGDEGYQADEGAQLHDEICIGKSIRDTLVIPVRLNSLKGEEQSTVYIHFISCVSQ